MQVLRFALRNLWRDLKSGELSVLLLALTVAVLSLTAVGFFTSRISLGVRAQAAEVLAADLRLESPNPIADRYFSEARARGLATRCAGACASPTRPSVRREPPIAYRAAARSGSMRASSPN
jgi:predicted lysophospholipase L1 biosynthesis ABC-type transport system permease subunit